MAVEYICEWLHNGRNATVPVPEVDPKTWRVMFCPHCRADTWHFPRERPAPQSTGVDGTAEAAVDNAASMVAAAGFVVVIWRNGKAGWLAALLDRELERVPNTVCWDYSATASAALQMLVKQNAALLASAEQKARST